MIDFMILGAQKAATSTLQATLRACPEVYMPEGESPLFEDPEYSMGLWREFSDPLRKAKVCGIKRPDNLCDHDIRRRISRDLPDLKLIVVLREPISRAVSAYYHLVRHAHLPLSPLNAGISRCLDAYESGDKGTYANVVAYGLYGSSLECWRNYYSSDRFLIVSQEEVRNNLRDVIGRCCLHLGIDLIDSPPLVADANIGVYDLALLRVARWSSVLKTRRLADGRRRAPRENGLGRFAGQALAAGVARLAARSMTGPEMLSSQNLDRLRQIYKDDEVRLRRVAPDKAVYWSFDAAR